MEESQIMQIIVQTQNNPKELFSIIPEHAIWKLSHALLNNRRGEIGLLFMLGIEGAIKQINDKDSLIHVLYETLSSPVDDLIYEVTQRIILTNAENWNSTSVRQLYRLFEDSYLEARDQNSVFVARLAIEGRLMLPILREDERQYYPAAGFLLEEFPPFPKDDEDPAYLVIKALKLLGLYYDFLDVDSQIADQIQVCLRSENTFVKSEASFNYGLIKLHDSFRANNIADFQVSLNEAIDYFEQSSGIQENRTDADLLIGVCNCYRVLTNLAEFNRTEVSEAIYNTQEILVNRLILLGGLSTTNTSSLEFNLVKMITYLEQFVQQLNSAKSWSDLTPKMRILADLYQSIRMNDAREALIRSASLTGLKFIAWPELVSEFIDIQEIKAKLQNNLGDPVWRQSATKHELEFYELALDQLNKSSPNEVAATRFENFRVAAEFINPKLADIITELQEKGHDINETLFHVLKDSLELAEGELYSLASTNPALEICKKIIPKLTNLLSWQTDEIRWECLSLTIQLISNFYHHICISYLEKNGLFAQCKQPSGKLCCYEKQYKKPRAA